jgi:hypothetical protein
MTNIPWAPIVVFLAFAAGSGLVIEGVYLLAGPGWSFIAGAFGCFLLSAIILRGLMRG